MNMRTGSIITNRPAPVPTPSLAGLDATVYFPLVDLKFTNDRPSWLLMETYFNAQNDSLTWKFYSGDDGRTVDVTELPAFKMSFLCRTRLSKKTQPFRREKYHHTTGG